MVETTRGDATFRVRSLSTETSSLSHNWTGDSVRVTNCDEEGCENDPNVIVDGDRIPVEYTCSHLLESGGSLGETSLTIDYEASLPVAADTEINARQLHWRMLLAAVQLSGLDKCDFSQQYGYVGNSGTRRIAENSTALPTTLYAIQSDLRSSSVLDISCTELLPEDSESTECMPMRTVLTLKFGGQGEEAGQVYDYVQTLMEEMIIDRGEELLVSQVEKIEYVGRFGTPTNSPASQIIDDDQEISSTSVVRVGSIISGSSAILLLLTLFVFRRLRHHDSDTAEQLNDKEVGAIHDIETGSSHSAETPRASGSGDLLLTNSSDSRQSSTHDDSDMQSEGAVIPPVTSYDSSEGRAELEMIVPPVSSYDSTERTANEGHCTGAIADHPLPPRPPRRESTKLKKRRRRRKKKKKPSLQRVNSREQVNALEAIPESDDEGSEFGSEEGSEYSTDDDASYQSSSGCNTPLRSQPNSRSSSRNSSPRLPQQDELFPSDVFSTDVDFLSQAADFFFPHIERVTSKSESPNNDNTPVLSPNGAKHSRKISPTSEQKIRPIPPPWV